MALSSARSRTSTTASVEISSSGVMHTERVSLGDALPTSQDILLPAELQAATSLPREQETLLALRT